MLSSQPRYVSNFSALFTSGAGWDVNNDTLADQAEVDLFLFDIGASPDVAAAVSCVLATGTLACGNTGTASGSGSAAASGINAGTGSGSGSGSSLSTTTGTSSTSPSTPCSGAPWTHLLNTPIASACATASTGSSTGTVGEYAVAQLQSTSQPFRAQLAELLGVWNGLIVASKPVAHLANLPAPTNTSCYGFVAPSALFNNHMYRIRVTARSNVNEDVE